MSVLGWLSDSSNLTPHGFCLAWSPGLIGLHVVGDVLTGLAYYSIPLALAVFVRRRKDLAFSWMFWLFAAFILACGTTHFLEVATLWTPLYWADGLLKLVTALLSVATAAALWPLIPAALALPSPAALREVNLALQRQAAEREAVADRLRESEARFRALYDKAPVPLLATGSDGIIVAASDRLLELLGTRRDALLGRDVASLGIGDSAPALRDAWRALVTGSALRDLEARILGAEGSVIDVQVSASREQAAGTGLVIAAVTDITGRKAAEQALRSAQESLHHAQKMEAIGQLTGGVAHDFNNMLTVIGGSLEMLRRQTGDEPANLRLIGLAEQGVHKAAQLTAQLLSFARRQRLAPSSLNPHQVVAGMSGLLAGPLGPSIRLEIEPAAADAWACLADRNQLESALLNLVLNARDAISDNGTIRIAARNHREHGGTDLPRGDYVAITVADDGAGIPPEALPHVFEPFFTTKPRGEGTGLGLAQIWGFARQSGGTVRIESEPGRGTVVTIILPRAAPPTMEPMRAAAPAEAVPGRGETILLAEDEPGLRELATLVLSEAGFTVLAVPDAASALAKLEDHPNVALLFTDIVMPGAQDGIELARVVRARRPDLPVVFATGYSARRPEAAEGRLLAKPYSPELLVRTIRECLNLAETRQLAIAD